MSYSTKLLDPRWQRRRLEIFQRDGWQCSRCRRKDRPLHVHHKVYTGEPWEARDGDLETLCDDCHLAAHPPRPLDPETLPEWRSRVERRLSAAVQEIREIFDECVELKQATERRKR